MGKVQRLPAGLASAGSSAAVRHNEQLKQSRPEYKVQLEQVTQRKKKLLSMTTYKVQAPPGYTFVPLTAPELTDKCKDLSRLEGVQVHVVSTSKGGKNSTELSKQVGRVGHHFPSSVVSRALMSLGYDMDSSGRILNKMQQLSRNVGNEASRKDQKGTRIGDGISDPVELKKAQEKLNNDARQSLTTLFPNMPEKDRKAVIKHAFVIGKDRIGSSAELSLDRRVHLAVLAHIRHIYTDYDKLLKQVPYQTARSIVEQKTLQKIVQWRGEDDNDEAVEEILREVIVIDDDDEDVVQIDHVYDEEDQWQFRSSPIAADKVDSRPHVLSAQGHPRADLQVRSTGGSSWEEREPYPSQIELDRQRRYDDRRRTIWQEAKRNLRRIAPEYGSATYVPLRAHEEGASRMYHDPEVRVQHSGLVERSDRIYSGQRSSDDPSRPQLVLVEQPQVGVTYEPSRGGRVEFARAAAADYRRWAPERHEVVHQSIERSPPRHSRQNSRPEVINLVDSSPVTVSVHERQHPVQSKSDHHVMIERREHPSPQPPPPPYRDQGVSIYLGQSGQRKRTFEEIDPRMPRSHDQDLYVDETSARPVRDAYVRLPAVYESPSKVRATEYVPHDRLLASPRASLYDGFRDGPARRVSSDLHFYQDSKTAHVSHNPHPMPISHRDYHTGPPSHMRPLEVANEMRPRGSVTESYAHVAPTHHAYGSAQPQARGGFEATRHATTFPTSGIAYREAVLPPENDYRR